MPRRFTGKIEISGKKIEFLSDIKIDLSLDSIASTFSFRTRFNPENDDHKELFKPLSYQTCKIYSSDDKLMLTGTILNHAFESNKDVNLVAISGYSKCGILEDVCVPVSAYPLESLNRSLKDIASRLCGLFGIGLVIDSSVSNLAGQVFATTEASPTDTIKTYLSKLTSQKNIVLSHDAKGNVVMFKPNGEMKAKYYFNSTNSLSMSSSYNGQGMHSHIQVVRQPSEGNEGSGVADSITNPLIKLYRPSTKVLSSGEDTDTANAANNELAAELKNIGRKVKLLGCFDDIKPGDIVNIHDHATYSFAYSRYMVSSINFTFSEKEDITELDLVLPETYTGEIPKDILFFYKTHLHNI